jgi:hypothetical protein
MRSLLFNPQNFNRREQDIFADETAFALVALPEESDFVALPEGCVELTAESFEIRGTRRDPGGRSDIGASSGVAAIGFIEKWRKLLR